MARKRKTLPKNFGEMLTSAPLEELIAVFDSCAIDAYGGLRKGTALSFIECPDELVVWLVEQGLDVDIRDPRGYTPLMVRAEAGRIKYVGQIPLLLSLGADLEATTPRGQASLQLAVLGYRSEAAEVLLEQGAKSSGDGWNPETMLESVMALMENFTIAPGADLARLLLSLGAPITEQMRASVERIGTQFERARPVFAADMLGETAAALEELYTIFDVTPVGGRVMHDGTSPIGVTSGIWQEQHRELWELLVPVKGVAATEQGEAIRITGKVADEMFRNGGMNWNAEFRTMVDGAVALPGTRSALPQQSLAALRELAPQVRVGRGSESELNRFSELAVEWVLRNPNPHTLGDVAYNW